MIQIKESALHGRGVFATVDLRAGTILPDNLSDEEYQVIADDDPRRFDHCVVVWPDGQMRHHGGPTGKTWTDWVNHATPPNAIQVPPSMEVMIIKDVEAGEEIVIDYADPRNGIPPEDPCLEVLEATREADDAV